jgi:flagellar L-ring protein precursor FlgH
MRHHCIVALLAVAAASPAQNLFQRAQGATSVIADLRAAHVGDILTVTIQETHSVNNEDKIQRTNDTTLAASLAAWTINDKTFPNNVLPKVDVRKNSAFNGDAKQNNTSDVRASIAVIVVDVQPNGNLVIAGSRSVMVNDETKTLKISGIVRPLDITQTNTVTSAQVADARVAISGEGASNRTVTRGPLGTLFDTLIWAAWPF